MLDRELPVLDLRDEEQIVDQAEQAVRVSVDDVRVQPLPLRELLVPEQLEVAEDRRQRRANLVRDERDESVLETVELAQALVRLQFLHEHALALRLDAVALGHVTRVQHDAAHVPVLAEIGHVRLESPQATLRVRQPELDRRGRARSQHLPQRSPVVRMHVLDDAVAEDGGFGAVDHAQHRVARVPELLAREHEHEVGRRRDKALEMRASATRADDERPAEESEDERARPPPAGAAAR